MPHSVSHLSIAELHPTFAAEVIGVDFSKPIESTAFQEIYSAITKVSHQLGLMTKVVAHPGQVWRVRVSPDKARRRKSRPIRIIVWRVRRRVPIHKVREEASAVDRSAL